MAPITNPGQGRAQTLLAFNVVFLILPYPFILARLWARRLTQLALSWNDYLLVIALIFTTGFNCNTIVSTVDGGYGQHIKNLSSAEKEVNLKTTIAATTLWPTANAFVKFSVLHFYRSIFSNQRTAYATYTVGALTVAWWLSCIIAVFAICRPFESNWNMTIKGHCGNTKQNYLSIAIVNLLIDVMIVALPLPSLWGLQMRRSRKIALTVIFSLGAIICLMSIARCYAIAHLSPTDSSYNIVFDQTTTALEPTLGVINACLPILQPVATKVSKTGVFTWIKSIRSSTFSERKKSSGKRSGYNDEVGKFRRLSGDQIPLQDTSPNDVFVTTDVTVSKERRNSDTVDGSQNQSWFQG